MMLARFALRLLTAIAFLPLEQAAHAHDYKLGALRIEHPWIQVVPKLAGGAAYFAVSNTGEQPDRLTRATIQGLPAELHSMTNDGRMQAVHGGLDVGANVTVTLAPGGYHLMIPELRGAFKDGEMLKGALVFKNAGTMNVEFQVHSVSVRAPSHHAH